MTRTTNGPNLFSTALAAACLMLSGAHPVAAAENVFEPYAGSFSGQGTLRRQPDEPRETVRCRIKSALSQDGLTMIQAGTCVVPGSKVSIDSKLEYDPATRRVKGSWTDVANGSAASVSGSETGGRIRLTIVGKDRQTGENRTLWMTLEPTAGGYSLATQASNPSGGGRFASGEIRFTR